MIAPIVSFDQRRYCLGYGPGFYDRTLPVLTKKPRGVGYSQVAIATIYPLRHDTSMDVILTEETVVARRDNAEPVVGGEGAAELSGR